MKPCNSNVLLEIEQPAKVSHAGILLPESMQQSQRTAKVLAAGPLCTELIPGDRVLIPWYGGLKMDQPSQILMPEHEIFGKLTE